MTIVLVLLLGAAGGADCPAAPAGAPATPPGALAPPAGTGEGREGKVVGEVYMGEGSPALTAGLTPVPGTPGVPVLVLQLKVLLILHGFLHLAQIFIEPYIP